MRFATLAPARSAGEQIGSADVVCKFDPDQIMALHKTKDKDRIVKAGFGSKAAREYWLIVLV